MFTPYDYQLDYLKALHLFYYAFPNPIHVQYYTLNNAHELNEATSDTRSVYSHLLDDTSIARFTHIKELPVYNTEGNSPKVQNADEFGNTFLQPELNIVIPAIFGLYPKVGDFVQFKTTGLSRLFQVSNIEHNNVHELGNLKLYKITLKIDKNNNEDAMNERITKIDRYSHEFAKILKDDDYNYIMNNLINVLNYYISLLDSKVDEEINVFMSKFYNDFNLEMMVMLEKFDYNKFDLLIQYDSIIYNGYFDNPLAFQIPMLELNPDIGYITDALSGNIDDTNNMYGFITDLNNRNIQIKDYGLNNKYEQLAVVYLLLKEIKIIVSGAVYDFG